MIEVPEDHFNKNDIQNVYEYKFAMYFIALLYTLFLLYIFYKMDYNMYQ